MTLFFYSNTLAAILKMANLTVIGLYFSLETVIFAFYGKFSIRMWMSPYSTNDVRMDLFLGFVSEMESRLHSSIRIFVKHEYQNGRHKITEVIFRATLEIDCKISRNQKTCIRDYDKTMPTIFIMTKLLR